MKWATTLATPSTSHNSMVSDVDNRIVENQQATTWSARQIPIRMNIAFTRNLTARSMKFAISNVISLGSPFAGLLLWKTTRMRRV
jgi:hypothetical protein